MKKPKNNKQEVLLTLIDSGKVSIFDYPHLSGFRTRISELVRKHDIKLESVSKSKKNRFGNTFTYTEHRLPATEKNKAIQVYNSL